MPRSARLTWPATEASNLVAGAMNTGFPNVGDTNDTKFGGPLGTGNPNMISDIAGIMIGGAVTGTTTAGDHFGFVAQKIGSFRSLGYATVLRAAALPHDVIDLSRTTADATYIHGDVTIREI